MATATIVIVSFLGDAIEAGAEADLPAATVDTPKLVCDGVELTLAATKGREFKAGDRPEFELTAVNTLNKPARASVGMTMTAAAPSNPLSRVISIPSVLWQEEKTLTLAPRETKVIPLLAETNLPSGNIISVTLRDLASNPASQAPTNSIPAPFIVLEPQQGIVALSFSTVVSNAAPTFVTVAQ